MNKYEKIGLVFIVIALDLGSTGYLASFLDNEVTFDPIALMWVVFALCGGIVLFLWGDK